MTRYFTASSTARNAHTISIVDPGRVIRSRNAKDSLESRSSCMSAVFSLMDTSSYMSMIRSLDMPPIRPENDLSRSQTSILSQSSSSPKGSARCIFVRSMVHSTSSSFFSISSDSFLNF